MGMTNSQITQITAGQVMRDTGSMDEEWIRVLTAPDSDNWVTVETLASGRRYSVAAECLTMKARGF